jgi:hypothetical protein
MPFMLDELNEHYTQPNPELERIRRQTYAGMAHWAGSGPSDKTCRECVYWVHYHNQYHSKNGPYQGKLQDARCTKYLDLMGHVGMAFPDDAKACMFFEQAENPPDKFKK